MVHPSSAIDRKLMRTMNRKTLLNLVRLHAPVSRTQLMMLSGLSSATVVTLTAQLLEQELIVEQGIAESTIGRKAGLLELHPTGRYVLGLSLVEEETIAVGLFNLLGEVIYSESWAIPLRQQKVEIVQLLAKRVATFLTRCSVPREKILGLGCGFPGYVAAQTGHIVDDWIHRWHDLPVSSLLSQELQMPVYIDNIINCLGSYEQLFGHGKQYHDFIVVTLGRGIGLAMIINGEVYRGANGGGGEFGHIPSIPGGRLCECGNRGCLEAYVADQGLLASYYELCQAHPGDTEFPPDLTPAQLHTAAQEETSPFRQIFLHAGHLLGCGLATLVNLLNPECIILTGPNVMDNDVFFSAMRETLQKHTFS
ncbi:MAG: ROK family protein, partial [Ktedonobacteraceae bacterium]|nr:ROK family protein [Ktedonobacteraceae bacterium]